MRLAPLQSTVLSHLIGASRPVGEIEGLVSPPPSGSVADRWHIYTSGYLARLVEALENDYPAVRRILGARAFGSLVRRFSQAHPSRFWDLGQAGQGLARFLDADPLSGDLGFLPDLARFEWGLAEAFVAEDAAPLDWPEVASLPPEAVAEVPLTLHPSVRVIRSDWPLFDLHDAREAPDQGLSIDLRDRPLMALIHRQGEVVMRRVLDGEEATCLEALTPGITLAQLSERPGVPAGRLPLLFRTWIAGEVLAAPPLSSPSTKPEKE